MCHGSSDDGASSIEGDSTNFDVNGSNNGGDIGSSDDAPVRSVQRIFFSLTSMHYLKKSNAHSQHSDVNARRRIHVASNCGHK